MDEICELFGRDSDELIPELDLLAIRDRLCAPTRTVLDLLDSDASYADGSEGPEESSLRRDQSRAIGRALSLLSARSRAVVEMRFGLDGERPWTLAEIGGDLFVTRERVRQLEEAALRRLRQVLEFNQ